MEVSGTIVKIDQPTSGTSKAGKDWQKQEFVIETKDQYPKKICIQVMNDKVDDFSPYTEGMDITCSINIESKEFNGRYFTNITAWRLAGSESNR